MNTSGLKRVSRLSFLAAALVMWFGAAGLAEATQAQQMATLKTVINKVEVQRSGKGAWSAGKVSTPLYQGDRVRTLRNSKAAIVFEDNSEILLNQDTMLEVTRTYDTKKQGVVNQVRVFLGEVFNQIAPQKSTLEFKTPDAVATVRGTSFSISTFPEQSIGADQVPEYSFDTWSRVNKFRTRLAVLEGLVDFVNNLGSVLVGALQVSETFYNAAPSAPVLVAAEDLLLDWVQELGYTVGGTEAGANEGAGEDTGGAERQDEEKKDDEKIEEKEPAATEPAGPTAVLPIVPATPAPAPAPVISALQPEWTYQSAQALPLRILGKNFVDLRQVKLGQLELEFTVVDAGILEVLLPEELAPGKYNAIVTTAAGSSKAVSLVVKDPPQLVKDFVLSKPAFSLVAEPDGAVCWNAALKDNMAWQFVVIDDAGDAVSATKSSKAAVQACWNGKSSSKALAREGVYKAALQITDAQGNAAVTFTAPSVVIDNSIPVADVSVPRQNATVSGIIDIVGKVSDANLVGWTLQVDENLPFATGDKPEVRAQLNTHRLGGGAHTLRLLVLDKAQQEAVCDVPFIVEGPPLGEGEAQPMVVPVAPAVAVGRVVAVKGLVEVQRNGFGLWRAAAADVALFPTDRVRTAVGAAVGILFTDGSTLTLRGNSMVELNKRIELAHPLGELLTAWLYAGEALAAIDARAACLEVSGPDVTASSSGGTFVLTVEREKQAVDVTSLAQVDMVAWSTSKVFISKLTILEGQALLVNRWGSVQVGKLQTSTARSNEPPTKPTSVPKNSVDIDWL